MTLEQALENNNWISQKQALQEVRLHEGDVLDFLQEVGEKKEYTTQEVLFWLGY